MKQVTGTEDTREYISNEKNVDSSKKGAEGENKEAFLEVFKELEVTPHDLMQGVPREDENQQIRLANSAWVDYQLKLNGDWIN